jgi:hypothetical protein
VRFLIVLLLLVVGVVGFGFYRGWFRAASHSADGKADVTITVDKDKVQSDAKDAKAKVQGAGDGAEAPVPTDEK